MTVLDGYFGEEHEEGEESKPSVWYAVAQREGPSAWRKRQNDVTRRIANLLSMDAQMPIRGAAGTCLWNIAADLLTEFRGDDDLIAGALESLRKDQRWRETAADSIYKVKPSIIQRCHRLRAKAQHKDAYICPECGVHPCQCEEADDG